MKLDGLNKQKILITQMDNNLNKNRSKIIFQTKLEKANKLLEKVGLPKG